MFNLFTRTNKGEFNIRVPESWHETTVDQFQRLVKSQATSGEWIEIFSIITGIEATRISESTSHKLEKEIYKVVRYVLDPAWSWDALKLKNEFVLQPMFFDSEDENTWRPHRVKIDKNVGRMSVGQMIQARRSLQELKDIREGMSIVTAIYLQPLIDHGKFDMLRVIEIERIILKMKITDVYPLGFFLLRRLTRNGNVFTRLLNLLR